MKAKNTMKRKYDMLVVVGVVVVIVLAMGLMGVATAPPTALISAEVTEGYLGLVISVVSVVAVVLTFYINK